MPILNLFCIRFRPLNWNNLNETFTQPNLCVIYFTWKIRKVLNEKKRELWPKNGHLNGFSCFLRDEASRTKTTHLISCMKPNFLRHLWRKSVEKGGHYSRFYFKMYENKFFSVAGTVTSTLYKPLIMSYVEPTFIFIKRSKVMF